MHFLKHSLQIKLKLLASIYQKVGEIENSNTKAVVCTIISTKGSTPRKIGAKMIVFTTGKILGTIGGGALEKKVIEQAQETIKTTLARIVSHNLVSELGMCCGGTVELFLEPIMNKKKLYIFGAGHIGIALAQFSKNLDFNVTLIDSRTEMFEDFDCSEIEINQEHHSNAITQLVFDEHTFVVILTHDHAYDREILALTSQKKTGYIGMIGSKRKVEIAKKNLLASKLITVAEILKVDMPIGLEINAKTPQEIAISILGKLIHVRNS